jgi:cobalt transporter subunit CbtB
MVAVVFGVAFEQGALTGGLPVLHEAFHDARHLLGFPCH